MVVDELYDLINELQALRVQETRVINAIETYHFRARNEAEATAVEQGYIRDQAEAIAVARATTRAPKQTAVTSPPQATASPTLGHRVEAWVEGNLPHLSDTQPTLPVDLYDRPQVAQRIPRGPTRLSEPPRHRGPFGYSIPSSPPIVPPFQIGDRVFITNKVRTVRGKPKLDSERFARVTTVTYKKIFIRTDSGFDTWRAPHNLNLISRDE